MPDYVSVLEEKKSTMDSFPWFHPSILLDVATSDSQHQYSSSLLLSFLEFEFLNIYFKGSEIFTVTELFLEMKDSLIYRTRS
jgi:hypothetical protein